MENQVNIQDRPWAAITGASSGIGYELAKVFAKNNFNLIVAAEDAGITEVGNAFRQFGGEVKTVRVDLSTYDGVEKLYEEIKMINQPLDSLALNAGFGVGGQFTDTSLEEELKLIQLNVASTVHLAKRVIPDFIAEGHGNILITSSIAAEMPGPYLSVYSASKAFVQSFAEALHQELKDFGIMVTALQPGATETQFFERAGMQDTKIGAGKKDDPAKVAQDGFDALMKGKDHVIAGSLLNKVQTNASKFISQEQAAKIEASKSKPGSAQK